MKFLRTALTLVLAGSFAGLVAHADPVAPKVTEFGHGPTVVFVPGLGAGRLDWMPTAKRLLATHHVVLADLPGQGDSPLPDPFTLQNAAAALGLVLAKQNPDSTIVVGQGVGGLVSLLALSAHPEYARGVVLIDTQIKSPIPVPDQQREQLMRFMDDNYQQFSQMAFSRMGRDSAESARLMTAMSAVPAVTVKAYFRELIAVDANKDLKGLKTPAKFVLSERMWKNGTSWGTIAKALGVEDSTAVTGTRLAGAGYLAMKDQPDSLADIVRTFGASHWTAKK